MTEALEHQDIPTVPDCFMSSNKYASYLWLGHCIFNPILYRNGLMDFHDDEERVEQEFTRFQHDLQKPAENILLPLLTRIVHSAHLELDEELPRTAAQRRRLQVYLVGEISVRGMERMDEEGWIEDYPAISQIQTPFRDSTLIEKIIRFSLSRQKRTIQTNHLRLVNYATLEKLLPGYPLSVTSEE